MYIDNKLINSGNLLEDMEPPIVPPKEIIDITDRKPDEWDDREKIADITVQKPGDWDETEPREIADESASMPDGWLETESTMVPDPNAVKPGDWDDDIDGAWEAPSIDNPLCQDAPGCGEWTAPMIPNPLYRGAWRAPLVENPNYRGVWEPRKIANPDYFEETRPYKLTPIGSVGLELWSMVDGVVFDNFLITSDQSIAKQYDDQIWYPKSVLEGKAISSASESVVDAIVRATKDRPWLWAVYLIAILLPLIILFVFCWSRKSTKKSTDVGTRKKTDEVEADSNEQEVLTRDTATTVVDDDGDEDEEEAEAEEIEVIQKQTKHTVTTVTGKDALENEEDADVEVTQTTVEQSNKNSSSPAAGNKARRRPRKE